MIHSSCNLSSGGTMYSLAFKTGFDCLVNSTSTNNVSIFDHAILYIQLWLGGWHPAVQIPGQNYCKLYWKSCYGLSPLWHCDTLYYINKQFYSSALATTDTFNILQIQHQ